MSIKVAKTRFILPPLDKHAGFYQYLLSRASTLKELGDKLVRDAEVAFAFRQVSKLEEIGIVLSNLPIKEYQLIGQYYRAWCAYQHGESPQSEFESVLTHSISYKARALISMAAMKARDGDYDAEIEYFTEAKKYSTNPTTLIKAAKGIAVAKSKQGFRQSALKDLERISPLIKHASLDVYYDCLNSLAVELGEAGRKYEARNVIRHALESPFIIAYPEWRETAEELKEPNRSFAVLNPTKRRRKGKLLSMPVIEHAEPIEEGWPAPVINLETWKANMGKKKNGGDHEDLDSRELLLKVMELSTAPGMTDGKLLQVIQYMYKLLIDAPKPDDDNDDEPGA